MPLRLEDYGLIGDTPSAALVGYAGSIDWLCLPRFDSGACFAALLGEREHGRWLLAPAGGHRASARRYRPETLVLETEFTTADGVVRVIDCVAIEGDHPDVHRRVEGISGRSGCAASCCCGWTTDPSCRGFREVGRRTSAFAGPDALTLDADVDHHRAGDDIMAEFDVDAGEHAQFRLVCSRPRWTRQCAASRTADSTARWTTGSGCARTSSTSSATGGTTADGTPSRSTTGHARWMPRCC